nr:AIG1-like protein [Tanacetum cinerariifolium]
DGTRSFDDDNFDDPCLTGARMKFANTFDINLCGQRSICSGTRSFDDDDFDDPCLTGARMKFANTFDINLCGNVAFVPAAGLEANKVVNDGDGKVKVLNLVQQASDVESNPDNDARDQASGWKRSLCRDGTRSFDDDDDPCLTGARMKFANTFDINLCGQLSICTAGLEANKVVNDGDGKVKVLNLVQQASEVESNSDNDARDQASELKTKMSVDGKQDDTKAVKVVGVADEQNNDEPNVLKGNRVLGVAFYYAASEPVDDVVFVKPRAALESNKVVNDGDGKVKVLNWVQQASDVESNSDNDVQDQASELETKVSVDGKQDRRESCESGGFGGVRNDTNVNMNKDIVMGWNNHHTYQLFGICV